VSLEQPEEQQGRHLHRHHAQQRAAEESRAMVRWWGAGHVKWQEDIFFNEFVTSIVLYTYDNRP